MSSNLKVFNETISNPRTQDYLKSVLSEKKSSFVNNLTALVSNNKKLQECEPLSLMYAGIKATALNLPLDSNLGFAYVIPFKNNKEHKTEAQFQMGYKGYIQLAIRSGQFRTINVIKVKEGEIKHRDMLTGDIEFEPVEKREDKKTIGYAAFIRLTNGFEKTLYMTSDEIEKHAKKYSQTYSSKYDDVRKKSKWTTDFDAMAEKTVLKRILSKYAPLSVEMKDAVLADQSVITEHGQKYVDNVQDIDAEEVTEEVNDEKKEKANKQEVEMQSPEKEEKPTKENPNNGAPKDEAKEQELPDF